MDKIRSTTYREDMMKPISTLIEMSQMRQFENVSRINEERFKRKICETWPRKQKGKGRRKEGDRAKYQTEHSIQEKMQENLKETI